MAEQKGRVVLSASELEWVELINGGDTAEVQLEGADGREIALALPRAVAIRLGRRLVGLAQPGTGRELH